MKSMKPFSMRAMTQAWPLVPLFATIAMLVSSRSGTAYIQYSENGDLTNCASCHGDFRAASYISEVDGQNWGNLHNLHRTTMLSGDCDACHSGAETFPVILDLSNGGTGGLAPISCVGCHGRAEDNVAGNPEVAAGRSGYGAGLRQHHQTTGVLVCSECHLDANPANYTPAGENVLPPFYANPGTGHPAMPTVSCNDDGSEDFAGAPQGLDNDGDDLFDGGDSNCMAPVEERTWGLLKSLFHR
jgi:hypothetical protein